MALDHDEAGQWAGLLCHFATSSPAALAGLRGWMAQHRRPGDAPVPGAAELAATLAAVHGLLAPACRAPVTPGLTAAGAPRR